MKNNRPLWIDDQATVKIPSARQQFLTFSMRAIEQASKTNGAVERLIYIAACLDMDVNPSSPSLRKILHREIDAYLDLFPSDEITTKTGEPQ
jgi:hypothetical protein